MTTLRGGPAAEDPAFNTSDGTAAIPGSPSRRDEMHHWVEPPSGRYFAAPPAGPRDRLRDRAPGFRLAPRCEAYCGTDFSRHALIYVAAVDERAAGPPRVVLLLRAADDFSGIEPASFDTVIINSVVQYFSSIEYLVKVLEGAARVVAPGGRILVGDVRSLPLLEAFHTSVALSQAEATPCPSRNCGGACGRRCSTRANWSSTRPSSSRCAATSLQSAACRFCPSAAATITR